MRFSMTVVLAALTVAFAVPAMAELQNVEVGGQIRIRYNYYSAEAGFTNVAFTDNNANSMSFGEQRTRLNVLADFTNDVSAFIEIDSYDVYGEDFRSDYITGIDGRSFSGDDVEIYQAYIEMRESWGWPLTIRIGRQEMMLGSEWLVGNNDTASFFRGLSFDGIRAWYDMDTLDINAFAFKLAEFSPLEEDGDTDFYGVYAAYSGFEEFELDAYWMYIRDARGAGYPGAPFAYDTSNVGLFPIPVAGGRGISGRIGDGIERLFGVDQYDDTTALHTIGLRGAGSVWGFDFEAEVAYQFGEATNVVRTAFQPDPNSVLTGPTVLPIIGAFPIFGGPYGDDDKDFDAFGANAEVGYQFDTSFQPRVFLGAAWFQGDDTRKDTFGEFLRNLLPFYTQDAAVSFNRLFSDWEYSEFLENTDLSNAWVFRGGVSAQPTEKTEILLAVSYFMADEPTYTNGLLGIPFFSRENDDELGWEVGLYLTYDYSEDLAFNFGYAHFFAGDGVDSERLFGRGNVGGGLVGLLIPQLLGGNFVQGNGLIRVGGVDDEDADYFFAETSIKF